MPFRSGHTERAPKGWVSSFGQILSQCTDKFCSVPAHGHALFMQKINILARGFLGSLCCVHGATQQYRGEHVQVAPIVLLFMCVSYTAVVLLYPVFNYGSVAPTQRTFQIAFIQFVSPAVLTLLSFRGGPAPPRPARFAAEDTIPPPLRMTCRRSIDSQHKCRTAALFGCV